MAHNEPRNPDSIPIDFTDCYNDDTHETRRMIHIAAEWNAGAEEERTKLIQTGQ